MDNTSRTILYIAIFMLLVFTPLGAVLGGLLLSLFVFLLAAGLCFYLWIRYKTYKARKMLEKRMEEMNREQASSPSQSSNFSAPVDGIKDVDYEKVDN